jgi:hypothetical protein
VTLIRSFRGGLLLLAELLWPTADPFSLQKKIRLLLLLEIWSVVLVLLSPMLEVNRWLTANLSN